MALSIRTKQILARCLGTVLLICVVPCVLIWWVTAFAADDIILYKTDQTLIPYNCTHDVTYSCSSCEVCTNQPLCNSDDLEADSECCNYNLDPECEDDWFYQVCQTYYKTCHISQVNWRAEYNGVFQSETWTGTLERDCGSSDDECQTWFSNYELCFTWPDTQDYTVGDGSGCGNLAIAMLAFLMCFVIGSCGILLWSTNYPSNNQQKQTIDLETVTLPNDESDLNQTNEKVDSTTV